MAPESESRRQLAIALRQVERIVQLLKVRAKVQPTRRCAAPDCSAHAAILSCEDALTIPVGVATPGGGLHEYPGGGQTRIPAGV